MQFTQNEKLWIRNEIKKLETTIKADNETLRKLRQLLRDA